MAEDHEGASPGRLAPESAEAWFARVEAALDGDRTLPASPPDGTARWDAFPFVIADDARTHPVAPLTDLDRPRTGESSSPCHCAGTTMPGSIEDGPNLMWRNDSWQLRRFERTGLPIIAILEPIAHHDLPELPDALSRELGLLIVRLAASIETLPSVGRCHVNRWGDGGAHAHVWFFARPLRHPQVTGSVVPLWDDLLPALPDTVRDANAAHVARELVARHGGITFMA